MPSAAQDAIVTPATIQQPQAPLKNLDVKDDFPKEVEELGVLPKVEPTTPTSALPPPAPQPPPPAAAQALPLPVPVELPPAPRAAAAPSPPLPSVSAAPTPVALPPLPAPPAPDKTDPVKLLENVQKSLPSPSAPTPPAAPAAAPTPVTLPLLAPPPAATEAAKPLPVALPAAPVVLTPVQPSAPPAPIPVQAEPSPPPAQPAAPVALPLPSPPLNPQAPAAPAPVKHAETKAAEKPKPDTGHLPFADRARGVLTAIPSGVSSLPVQVPPPSTVTIERADPGASALAPPPAAGAQAPAESGAASALGINLQQKAAESSTPQLLEDAYQALIGGHAEQAISLYQQAVAREPKNELALFGLATTYQRIGQRKRALGYYETLLSAYPNHQEGMNNFLLLVAEESPAEAMRQLEILERRAPEFAPAAAQLGMLHYRHGNLQIAAQKLEKAIRLEPDNLIYRYNMAIIQDKLGNAREAVKLYALVLDAGYKGAVLPDSLEKIQRRLTFLRSK